MPREPAGAGVQIFGPPAQGSWRPQHPCLPLEPHYCRRKGKASVSSQPSPQGALPCKLSTLGHETPGCYRDRHWAGRTHLIKQENQESPRGTESKRLRAGAQLGGGPAPSGGGICPGCDVPAQSGGPHSLEGSMSGSGPPVLGLCVPGFLLGT